MPGRQSGRKAGATYPPDSAAAAIDPTTPHKKPSGRFPHCHPSRLALFQLDVACEPGHGSYRRLLCVRVATGPLRAVIRLAWDVKVILEASSYGRVDACSEPLQAKSQIHLSPLDKQRQSGVDVDRLALCHD